MCKRSLYFRLRSATGRGDVFFSPAVGAPSTAEKLPDTAAVRTAIYFFDPARVFAAINNSAFVCFVRPVPLFSHVENACFWVMYT